MSALIIDAARLRECVGFRDLVEPTACAFREFSDGKADARFVSIFPAERPELGDVYVKTGTIRDTTSSS